MDQILIMFVVFVALVIYVVLQVQRALQNRDEAQHVYKNNIPEERAKYLNDVFGIRKPYCDMLRFDGYYFNFVGEKEHYENIASIRYVAAKALIIHNENLPGRSRWLHQRVDGGPDRRYKENHIILVSNKISLDVEKKDGSSFITTIYHTSSSLSYELDIINKFLHAPSHIQGATAIGYPTAIKN